MSDLIDRQALRAAHGLGSDCHDCKRDMKSCQYDRDYSLMDFCEWLDDAPTASPWHRVEEEEPTKAGWYLVMDVDGDFNVDEWHNTFGWQFITPSDADRITHWMPIEPPKEDA